MSTFWDIALWTTRGIAAFLLLLTLLPFVRTGFWFVRLCDFPRFQLAVLCVTFAGVLLGFSAGLGWQPDFWVFVPLLLLAAAWQAAHIARYTRLWPTRVADIPEGAPDRVRLLISNLDFRNDRKEEAARLLRSIETDIILLIEIDESWAQELADLRDRFQHRFDSIRGEGLGIALWTNLPVRSEEMRYLVSEERASIHAEMVFPGDERVCFIGLHPVPPGLPSEHGNESVAPRSSAEDKKDDGRYDSRIRDAELSLVGRLIARRPQATWVVAGDFNDVAWSHTTRLFDRISGLSDPRIGRKLLTTYHADYPPLRYPLDHVFVSPRMNVGRFERLKVPGSDHFAVLVELQVGVGEEVDPDADAEDRREARSMVHEGAADAKEQGESADQPPDKPTQGES